MLTGEQRDSAGDMKLALYVTDTDLIPDTSYGTLSPTRLIPEYKARISSENK